MCGAASDGGVNAARSSNGTDGNVSSMNDNNERSGEKVSHLKVHQMKEMLSKRFKMMAFLGSLLQSQMMVKLNE